MCLIVCKEFLKYVHNNYDTVDNEFMCIETTVGLRVAIN